MGLGFADGAQVDVFFGSGGQYDVEGAYLGYFFEQLTRSGSEAPGGGLARFLAPVRVAQTPVSPVAPALRAGAPPQRGRRALMLLLRCGWAGIEAGSTWRGAHTGPAMSAYRPFADMWNSTLGSPQLAMNGH